MSEDNFREPYYVTKSETSFEAQSPVICPAVLLPNPKTLSPDSENIITFLKSMTKSTIENIDPFYEDITFEESLQLQINKNIDLLKPDDEEMALGMALMLFQFSESLSNEGHLICSKYKEKLYTALYEYQMIKFADKTELERILRYTMLMELMHRVTVH
uniref:NR LBD domain-containing protein n=1 Tax=Panagrolaimus davidi TaxID=227884 RepID=A0A914QIX3_9BILA